MKDILEHIAKAREETIKRYIRANTIIIDKDVAKVNRFYYLAAPQTIADVPPMYMGLQVLYEKNLSETVGTPVNFVMAEIKMPEKPFKTPLSAYSTEELLDEIRKRVE